MRRVAPPPTAPDFDAATLGLTGGIDFVGLFYWRGEAFVRAVLDEYTREPDPGPLDRVRSDAVVAGGIWLAEAVSWQPPADVARNRACFERAIARALDDSLRAR